MQNIEEVKKALELCSPDGRCQYKTNEQCPYRITEFICERSKLLLDAKAWIENLCERATSAEEKMLAVRELVGPDCDNCDRW